MGAMVTGNHGPRRSRWAGLGKRCESIMWASSGNGMDTIVEIPNKKQCKASPSLRLLV